MGRRALAAGQLLGRYRLHGLLGETGWASTYAAYAGDDEIALKVVDASLAEREGVQAELEKAQEVTREFAVDGVLGPVDHGTDPTTGTHFVAVRLSHHPSLADLVEICPLSLDETVDLVGSLAVALAPLHDQGIGHLALKPTNVFVGPPPGHAARLGDFGSDALRRAAGKLHPWLAPEQSDALGGDAAGPRSDVFTTALLAFFALTGKSYWEASADDEAALLEEMRAVRKPASVRAREAGVTIEASLDQAFARALAVDPVERFAHATAFAEALANALLAREIAPTTSEAPSDAGHALSKPTPIADFAPLAAQALARRTPAPASSNEALRADRHVKATAKLARFELPGGAAGARPSLRGATARIGRFNLYPDPDPASSRAPESKSTVRMAPVALPNEAATATASTRFARFELPPRRPPPRARPKPQGASGATILVIIGAGCMALLLALIVIMLVTRR